MATEKNTNKKTSAKKKIKKSESAAATEEVQPLVFRSRAESLAAGKSLREKTPRSSHAGWKAPSNRRDPIDILDESNKDRLPELVPIRYGRMLRSPFAFLRGSSGLMTYDLSSTPTMGLKVQACGDCHLMNFGLFATPERNLIFDINDFDETLPAPGNGMSNVWRPVSRLPPATSGSVTKTSRPLPLNAYAHTGSTCGNIRR